MANEGFVRFIPDPKNVILGGVVQPKRGDNPRGLHFFRFGDPEKKNLHLPRASILGGVVQPFPTPLLQDLAVRFAAKCEALSAPRCFKKPRVFQGGQKFDLKIKTRIGWDGLGVTCFFLCVFRGEVQKRMGKDGKVS